MDHAQIIADLGGYQALAHDLRTAPNVVWRWGITRDIPARRWPIIVALAKRRGLPHITAEALLAGYEPARRQYGDDMKRIREAERARVAA